MTRKLTGAVVFSGVIAVLGAYAGSVRATPASGFVGTTLASARYDAIDVNVRAVMGNTDVWQSRQTTNGPSDLYIQSNVWAPGGSTGWHTHPGHSLITVTAGTITTYDAHDPTCTPHVYTAGMGFVDPGGAHVHVIRNEGAEEARTITVQLIPAGATRRIDAADPLTCPF